MLVMQAQMMGGKGQPQSQSAPRGKGTSEAEKFLAKQGAK